MDFASGLVIDTSVWINLLATRRIWDIVACLDTACIAPEQVVGEIQRDPISQIEFATNEHPLRCHKAVDIVVLEGRSLDLFFDLMGNDFVNNLGDGEAASIAVAETRECVIALDERKARRLVREQFPSLSVISSFELLALPEVRRSLGDTGVDAAIADAVRYGRMHVPHDLRFAIVQRSHTRDTT